MTTELLIPLQVFSRILEAELHARAMRAETERQVQLANIEASITSQQIQAQKEVAVLLITTARHVFDRKVDLLHASFDSVLGLIQRSHDRLANQRAELTTVVIVAKSKQERLIANERLGTVDRELARLEHEAATLHAQMQAFLRMIDISLPLTPLQIGAR